jgi:hypothetical protein
MNDDVCIVNLRNCIKHALDDSLIKEAGAGYTVTKVDGEMLYDRMRGILDAITPISTINEGDL